MYFPRIAAALCGAAWLAGPAQAATDATTLRTQALAANCANCHGTNGRALHDATVPGLAGQPAAYLVEQMQAFKSGTRPATLMHQISRGYSDAQIQALAAYFAALPRD